MVRADDPSCLERVSKAAQDSAPISLGMRRTSSPHEFYRYPARFSPNLAAAIIEAFSDPGDVVADYFVGGGTTLIEARRAGRIAIGSDINSLAVFVSNVKTRLYRDTDLASVLEWADTVAARGISDVTASADEKALAYFRNLDLGHLPDYPLAASSAIAGLGGIKSRVGRDFARCVLLRTAQWALDMRSEVPESGSFFEALVDNAWAMATVARETTKHYRAAESEVPPTDYPRCLVLHQGLPGIARRPELVNYPAPRLIVTSPPYPGVYVNYHRWKVRGRLETPFPYFLAGQEDGNGLAYYTMAARSDPSLQTYFRKLETAFSDVACICDRSTTLVQVVGFNNVDGQLPRYLKAMERAGFTEVRLEELATSTDGRLWRDVPGRRWWAQAGDRSTVATHTSREVVLIHRRS